MKTLAALCFGMILGSGLTIGAAAYLYPRIASAFMNEMIADLEESADRREYVNTMGFEPEEAPEWTVDAEEGYLTRTYRLADQLVEPQPRQTVSPYKHLALPEITTPVCSAVHPPKGAKVMAMGIYEGHSKTADVAFPQPNGHLLAAGSVEVVIEEGSEPIWILLSSYNPVMWNFSGDVDRIDHVVLADSYRGAGVEGIEKDRVSVMDSDCFGGRPGAAFYKIEDAWKVLGPVEELMGKEISEVITHYSSDRVFLPSGKNQRFGPGGSRDSDYELHFVDPRETVVGREIQRPEILPAPVGIAQLIEKGFIRKLSGHEEYKIIKQIDRLPYGSTGKFILDTEIDPPKTTSIHACIKDWKGKPLPPAAGTPFCD